ncbi:hypothetical protein Tco_0222842 [Tanacetum coccineum]
MQISDQLIDETPVAEVDYLWKVFIDSTTKVDSEPPNGSNDDITNPYECNQTLYVSADVRSSRNSNLMNMLQKMFGQNCSGLVLLLDDIRWQKRIFLHLNLQDEMNRSFIAQNSYRLERETFSKSTEVAENLSSTFSRSLLHDNIIPKPDLALELGKSISLTEAEEEAVAREVHATHARIVSGPDPEPMQEDVGKLHVSLAGPNPEHMDDEFLATAYPKVHENLKLTTDERVIEENPESHSGSMSSMKNLEDTDNFGDQFLYDKPTEDDQEKSKVVDESDSTIPDPSHQTVTSTPPVIAPFTDVSSTKPSLLVTPPPINTEATTITTSLPEITPFIALQLRVARLEQEMSEVKKTDHSADVLASIESQVPTAVDKYLGTKLDNALLKVLERHTADLIEKHSVLPGPESIQNQESEKSPKEIIRTKREQGEEKQDSTYSIRSTDKVDLEEFDLKSALFKHMNKIKSANRNTANYHLYHALWIDLIAELKLPWIRISCRQAGSNQGKSAKRRRHDSGASGSAQPPTKDDEQSSKKSRKSDASASKQHPALPSTGWKITDTRDADVDSSMHRSDPESEQRSVKRPATMNPRNGTFPLNDIPVLVKITGYIHYATTYLVPTDDSDSMERRYVFGSFIYTWVLLTQSGKGRSSANRAVQFLKWSSHGSCAISSGLCLSLDDSGYHSSGLVPIQFLSTPYVPPSKIDYEILSKLVKFINFTMIKMKTSTSTSPTYRKFNLIVNHQDELHRLTDYITSGTLVDKTIWAEGYKAKLVMEELKNDEGSLLAWKQVWNFVAHAGTQVFSNLSGMERGKTAILNGSTEGRGLRCSAEGLLFQISRINSLTSRESIYMD